MPKSYRHHRAAKLAAAAAPIERADYEITDPAHIPDLRGEFAGAKVQRVAGKQVVRLSASQAKFYLDQGALKPLSASAPTPKPQAKKAAKK